MSLFDDSLPAQTVTIAPSNGLSWLVYGHWAGEQLALPTAVAEALAREGVILAPAASPTE